MRFLTRRYGFHGLPLRDSLLMKSMIERAEHCIERVQHRQSLTIRPSCLGKFEVTIGAKPGESILKLLASIPARLGK